MIRTGAALAAAALAATTVTSMMVSLVASVADLLWILDMRDASPELKSVLGFDFGQSISQWPIEVLMSLLFSPFWAILFGFVGAFLFLAVGFLLKPSRLNKPRHYALAGAAIGLIHSTIGVALRLVDQRVGPTSDWEEVIQSVAGWGGFILTSMPRTEVVVATFPATIVAGAVAGLLYFRLAKEPAALAHA